MINDNVDIFQKGQLHICAFEWKSGLCQISCHFNVMVCFNTLSVLALIHVICSHYTEYFRQSRSDIQFFC